MIRPQRIAVRVALACLLVTAVAVAIIATGVFDVGRSTFDDLMLRHGATAADSRAMFNSSVGHTFIWAMLAAAVVCAGVAALLAHRVSRSFGRIVDAAQRIAGGDYAARVPDVGIEEARAIAEAFNRMAESLEEQERMRRELTANAAHELRTPLTNLKGYLEALRDEVIPPSAETFQSLQEEADRLVRLSRSLDLLAQGDAGHRAAPRDTDLVQAVRGAVELHQPGFQRAGIELEVEVPDRLGVRAHPDHLAQVLGNLLQNALRYTPAGGRARVGVRREGGSALVEVVNTTEGPDAIPADDLPRVFERFYRVEKSRDRARGGAGIGLAIVKQLVEGAGGRVGAEARPGTARFWFSLPQIVD
ncbi:MAG TPA: ATP-binding protein [Candidatus Dormibacteraeota bacterium]|nr:ATP-binding protein [Candidatus Dormibacteraeota bacterium]